VGGTGIEPVTAGV